jgi:hypothetical protein
MESWGAHSSLLDTFYNDILCVHRLFLNFHQCRNLSINPSKDLISKWMHFNYGLLLSVQIFGSILLFDAAIREKQPKTGSTSVQTPRS